MPTLKQIQANRRNAQLSTGPRTDEGKRASAQNALQSGIYAEREVLPFEDATQLEALIGEYHDRFRPTTPEARALVDSLIHNEWLLRRLRRAEAAIYHCDCKICTKHYTDKSEAEIISSRITWEFKKFDHVQPRISQTERNYHRSLQALQGLQPPPEPAQPEEPKPNSTKLASFPQNAFLSDLRDSSVGSVMNGDARTLGASGPRLASFPKNSFEPLEAAPSAATPEEVAPPDFCLLTSDSPNPTGASTLGPLPSEIG